jgi:ribonuclease P protein component
MLKAENRLKKQADFSETLRKGKRFQGEYLTIANAPNTEAELRLGVTVSKKVERKAVGRNRLRRVVSHIFEHLLKESPPSDDVVVIVRRRPENTIFSALEKDIRQWFAKASRSS